MKLQSMVAYLKEHSEIRNKTWIHAEKINDLSHGIDADANFIEKTINHSNFLSLNLEKWMFVPCDSDGNVLEEPNKYTSNLVINDEWEQAKSRVIFEGFEVMNGYLVNNDYDCQLNIDWLLTMTIEDLIPYNLTITEQAVKTYGL